jgi:hypothetical protein
VNQEFAGRRCLTAPGTSLRLIQWLLDRGCSIEWAPAPGGVAWWGSRSDDHLLVASQPSRLGLRETLPGGVEALVEVDRRFLSLLSGGEHTTLWSNETILRDRFEHRPDRGAIDLARATDFLRRRIEAHRGVAVVGTAPWLGAVPFLGGAPHTRLEPPMPGLPGLGVAPITSTTRRALEALAAAVVADGPEPAPPGGGVDLPRRRLGDLTLPIP